MTQIDVQFVVESNHSILANFTCTAGHCTAWPCDLNNAIWNNELSCFGNETFYRHLSESTTDNIEMRVFRDQDRRDEDIFRM